MFVCFHSDPAVKITLCSCTHVCTHTPTHPPVVIKSPPPQGHIPGSTCQSHYLPPCPRRTLWHISEQLGQIIGNPPWPCPIILTTNYEQCSALAVSLSLSLGPGGGGTGDDEDTEQGGVSGGSWGVSLEKDTRKLHFRQPTVCEVQRSSIQEPSAEKRRSS